MPISAIIPYLFFSYLFLYIYLYIKRELQWIRYLYHTKKASFDQAIEKRLDLAFVWVMKKKEMHRSA